MRGELKQSRVVALPSSCEGVPTVILEAMAAGRPIVATRVGHVATIVDDGVEGFLVELGDTAALSDRLIRLLTDSKRALVMGSAGRRRARHHDVQLVARTLLTALSHAARAHSPAPALSEAS